MAHRKCRQKHPISHKGDNLGLAKVLHEMNIHEHDVTLHTSGHNLFTLTLITSRNDPGLTLYEYNLLVANKLEFATGFLQ